MTDVRLGSSLFAILTALVEERTGMHYAPGDSEIFAIKLMSRAAAAGFVSPLDYYYYLRYDDPERAEFDALIDSLVVNETYFFRESEALRIVRDEVLWPMVQSGKRPRVWCAAASTGEEPLTVAMLLQERGLLSAVDILATDISSRALARAREGTYGARSLRAVGPDLRARWFLPNGDRFEVPRELRDAIEWRRVNIVSSEQVRALGLFDLILCRNVLIYFGEPTIRRVAQDLAYGLREGGRLLVGASESLLRFGSLLACEERRGAFLYARVP